MAQERDIVRAAMEESGFQLMTDEAPSPTPTPELANPKPEPTPAANEPAPTPQAIEKPEPAPTPAPEKEIIPFDENKWLSEKFGDKFKSVDEINNALKERDNLNSRFTEAEKKTKDLENRLSENSPANDYIKGLNAFVKKGGDPKIYEKVAHIDPSTLNEKDALVLKLRFEHGMKKEDAEFKVARKYKLGDEYDATDPDVRESRIDLQLDGKAAKDFLSQYKTEQLTPPGEKEHAQAEHILQTRLKSWEPQSPQLLSSLQKVEVPFDEKGNTVSFEIPKETMNHLADHLQKVIENMDVSPDENGKQLMKEVLLREVFYLHQKDVARLVAGAVNKQWAKDTHHPSALREENPTPAPKETDRDMDIAQFIAKTSGFKL